MEVTIVHKSIFAILTLVSIFSLFQFAYSQPETNTFDSSGDFGYHCSIHPFMTGVVIVE